MSEIIFYDIPSKTQTNAWSPNTWNTRFTLNLKGLKYRTEWVEYPDIEASCKKIGAGQTSTKSDGVTPHYTLPVIYDPSTKTVVADSFAIAEYLDTTYPNTPLVFPKNTRALHAAYSDAFNDALMMPLYSLSVLPTALTLNPSSYEYFRRTREVSFGKKLEEVAPEDERGEEVWAKLEAGFAKIASWLEKNKEKPFVGGDKITYADIEIAGRLIWAKIVMGEDSKGWQRIKAIDGGRWDRYLQQFDKYTTVV
ncbi:hypothetical protein EUX98_g3651 [Antrodiella citrinella]|uniref:GST N-terminal domain-containing protein n=1 Tax=Antrodiella citrinella TaxID=2447956 RepID=A0A4S4MYR9_9APHY|nr:hypothetical protein EUX98_g3651 [Antrodiella citrinella]